MVYNYYDDDIPGPAASVDLNLANLPTNGDATLTEYRIDEDSQQRPHRLGKNGIAAATQSRSVRKMKQAGQLSKMPDSQPVHIDGGKADVKIILPREAVSLLVLEWK